MSAENPWEYLSTLQYELTQFNKNFIDRPQFIIANKMDLPGSHDNLEILRNKVDNIPIIPISAKVGDNLGNLLGQIKTMYDKTLNIT